jgi:hypothetical protein
MARTQSYTITIGEVPPPTPWKNLAIAAVGIGVVVAVVVLAGTE